MVADMFIFGLPIVIQIIFFIVFSVKKNKQLRKHPMLLNTLSSVAASFLLIASVLVVMKTYDYKLECDLKTFDKDGDGIYSLQEIPEEQHQAYREAWDRLMHDMGRNYAPYFAAKFCVIYCPFTFIVQSLIDFFIYKRRKKT